MTAFDKIRMILFSCLLSGSIAGQRMPYLSVGPSSKEDIEKELKKTVRRAKKAGAEASWHANSNGDTLIFHGKNSQEGFMIKYTFRQPWPELEDSLCDYQEFIFDCSPCAQKHLMEFIHNCRFRKQTDLLYLPSYVWKATMQVVEQPGSKECLRLVFRYADLPKKEYNLLYERLKE